jgi:transaldolase
VPVNVTLLFSPAHYLAAAEAWMRGLERRLAAGLHLQVASVASLFVSRWDTAVKLEVASPFHNRLGIAMAMRTYRAHRELLASDRWLRLATAGARPQRLLWASTASRDPAAGDTLYVQALAARATIITLPDQTLRAFADHGRTGDAMPADGGYADAVLEEFRREGVDDAALAERLQREGVSSFQAAWHALLSHIAGKCGVASPA